MFVYKLIVFLPAFLSNRNYGRFSLGGQKYFYLSGDEEVLRGKQGKGGVHCVKTGQALLVGVYEDPMAPAQAGMYADHVLDVPSY